MALGRLVPEKKSEVSFRLIWGRGERILFSVGVFSLLGKISVNLPKKGIDGQVEVFSVSVGFVLCCRCFNVVLPTVCLSSCSSAGPVV